MFSGEQIVIDHNTLTLPSSSKSMRTENGSSISTALAAGTAALLLFITQLVNPDFYKKLQEPKRMRKAFEKFCPVTNPKYFKAQDYFDKRFRDLNWDWQMDGRSKVENLVNKSVFFLSS